MLERARAFAGLHVDIGTGDGAFVLRTARSTPGALVVGIDANAENLAECSRRAAAKSSRGGVPNALYVHASVDALPEELDGLVSRVTVLFPWGSLLRAVWSPEEPVLRTIRRIARDSARIAIAVSFSSRDASAFGGIDPAGASLPSIYAKAGWDVAVRETSERDWQTTWSRKLSTDPTRRSFELEGSASTKISP